MKDVVLTPCSFVLRDERLPGLSGRSSLLFLPSPHSIVVQMLFLEPQLVRQAVRWVVLVLEHRNCPPT
jgi:hypothetical protein